MTNEPTMIQQAKQRKWLDFRPFFDCRRLPMSILWCTTPSSERSGWRSSAFHRMASCR